MKGTLGKRLLLLSLLVLALTIAVSTGFSVESFRRQYRDGILRRGNTLATALRSQIEGVLGLGLPLAQIDGLAERCQAIVTNDPELAYCLIEDPGGAILYRSTTLMFEPAQAQQAGKLGDSVTVFDAPGFGRIYDLSVPLINYDGKLAGRIRIGFQKEILRALTADHLIWSLLVLGGASLAVFFLLTLFFRRDLVKPIRSLRDSATTIAAGNFNVAIPDMSTRELDTLAVALADMAVSLQQRDAELRSRYRELEMTNAELQLSYERLEAVSADLGRSQEMYRSLLDDASDAILVCDESDRVLIANKSAERFFGVSRERVEGEALSAFLAAIHCQNIAELNPWYAAISSGQQRDMEIRFLPSLERGQQVGWASAAAVVDRSGKRLVQMIVRDATQEEAVRQQLERAARELERLNRMKNSFLGLASHELKTPLTIIMGYVELLLNDMAKHLDDVSKDMLRHIGRASERLAEIVRDMVDVSMLDNRTLELVSQELDINMVVRRAVENAQQPIRDRRQKLHLELADDLPPVRCDQERMVQAIGNVLGNAIKFTPDFGLIRISTREVMRPLLTDRLRRRSDAGAGPAAQKLYPYVEIAIIDSGIGIPRDEQLSIFDKFYEVGDVGEHSSGKVAFKGRGAGLGLTIVKGVVSIHGGAVWVESPGYDPERFPGSTFYILLPAAKTPSAAAA